MWPAANLGNLAAIIPLVLLGMIFLVESAIMMVFAVTSGEGHNRWLEVILDSSLLTLTIAPVLYWLIVRPLQVLAEERSRLLAHTIEIQDSERRRLARDLHDEIGQSFTSLLVQLRVLEDTPTLEAAKAQARAIRELSGEVYDQVRGLARGIHPTVLDDLGLVEAVRRLAEDFESIHDARVILNVSDFTKDRLEHKVETTAYRIVQESLTNCAKYAQASQIDVTLSRDANHLTVTIADNGRGFDVGKAMHSPKKTTFGLTGMRERALLLNGSFTVRSQPGKGTTVTLSVPLGS